MNSNSSAGYGAPIPGAIPPSNYGTPNVPTDIAASYTNIGPNELIELGTNNANNPPIANVYGPVAFPWPTEA